MKITVSVDARVAERAHAAAQAMGKSLDDVVRDHLEQLAGWPQLEMEIRTFMESALSSPGRLGGWKPDRDEANRRA
jgi:antitoxin component of RelBE/YafQ-DinJ toxin-antitoxin module